MLPVAMSMKGRHPPQSSRPGKSACSMSACRSSPRPRIPGCPWRTTQRGFPACEESPGYDVVGSVILPRSAHFDQALSAKAGPCWVIEQAMTRAPFSMAWSKKTSDWG